MNGATQAVSGVRLWLSSADQKKLRKVEFERVALPQLSHLYTSAAYLTKDKAKAEDLVQETYLRAFRFFDKFETGTNVRAWLLSILRNLFINRYRQKRREPTTVDWEKVDEVYESIMEQGEDLGRGNLEFAPQPGSPLDSIGSLIMGFHRLNVQNTYLELSRVPTASTQSVN